MAKQSTEAVCGAVHWKYEDRACTLEPHASGDHVHKPSKTEFSKTR